MIQKDEEELQEIKEVSNKAPAYARKVCYYSLLDRYFRKKASFDVYQLESLVERQLKREQYRSKNAWHIAVRLFCWLVAFIFIWLLISFGEEYGLMAYDRIFAGSIVVTVSIAITYANSYNAHPEEFAQHKVAIAGDHLRSAWLHASYCWRIAQIWLTIASVYATGTVVYLTQDSQEKPSSSVSIIIYSVLSLTCSFATNILNAGKQAKSFKQAYQRINKALILYQTNQTEETLNGIAQAIINGEEIISSVDSD